MTLASELLERIEARHLETHGDDEETAELLVVDVAHILGRVLGPERAARLLLTQFRALDGVGAASTLPAPPSSPPPAPPATSPAPTHTWCYRASTCMRHAKRRRWFPLEGVYRPVCDLHAEGAGFTELLPLEPTPR